MLRCKPKVGKAIWRAGTEANPRLKVFEVGWGILWVKIAEGFDDTPKTSFADRGIGAANFHRSRHSERSAHGSNCNSTFFEKRAEKWIGGGFRKGY
jgi:hypothetical protein